MGLFNRNKQKEELDSYFKNTEQYIPHERLTQTVLDDVCAYLRIFTGGTLTPYKLILCAIGLFFIILIIYTIIPKNNTPEGIKQLESTYNQAFVTASGKKLTKDSAGVYTMNPKKNKDLKFNVYISETGSVETDYEQQYLKYLIQNCPDDLLNNIEEVQKEEPKNNNVNFLTSYYLNIKINSYSEIESALTSAYNLAKYLHEKDENLNGTIQLSRFDYTYKLSIKKTDDFDTKLFETKFTYIEYAEYNNSSLLFEIPKDDIKDWFPRRLELYVNGSSCINIDTAEIIQINCPTFNKEDYEIPILYVIPNSKCMKITSTNYDRSPATLDYNGETYNFGKEFNLDTKTIPYNLKISQLESAFDCTVSINEKNRSISINIK